jgi:hypothetical protein
MKSRNDILKLNYMSAFLSSPNHVSYSIIDPANAATIITTTLHPTDLDRAALLLLWGDANRLAETVAAA